MSPTSASNGSAATEDPAELVVLVGNPKPGSRTGRLAQDLAAALATALAGALRSGPEVVDLGAIAADPATRAGQEAAALGVLRGARLAVVATPTYKGAYTGLLKIFLDQLPSQALAGVVAVGVTTAAAPTHLPAGEAHLRPLLLELGAAVPAPVLAVPESALGDTAEIIHSWLTAAAPALAGALAAPRPTPALPGGTA